MTGGSSFDGIVNRLAFCLCSIALTNMLSYTLKTTVKRPRPKAVKGVKRHFNVRAKIAGGRSEFESFPSGDTAAGAAWGTTMAILTGIDAFYLVFIPVAFARVYYHCHWICDVLAGGLVGIVCPVILHFASPEGWRSYTAAHILCGVFVYGGYMKAVAGGHYHHTTLRHSND